MYRCQIKTLQWIKLNRREDFMQGYCNGDNRPEFILNLIPLKQKQERF